MDADRWQIIEQDGKVEILNDVKKKIQSFAVVENLPRALELLRQFNSIKDTRGEYLYNYFAYRGISLWSFHQEIIFWEYLRDFSKYEKVYQFISDQNITIILDLRQVSPELQTIIHTVPALKLTYLRRHTLLQKFFSCLLKFLGWCVSWLAITKLIVKKNLPLIYSPDVYTNSGCDFRIYPLYKYLWDQGKDYVEVFHTSWGKNFLGNFFKRKRLAIYLESLVWHPFKNKPQVPDADFSLFEPHVRVFFSSLLSEMSKRISVSQRLIKQLEKILALTTIKCVLALDDVRYTNELIVACRKNRIKIYGLQHGQYTKYHVGWMNYGLPSEQAVTFDTLFVWNVYWRKILLKYSSQYNERNAVVGGWLRKLPDFLFTKKILPAVQPTSQLAVLIPYEISLAKGAIQKYINRFFSCGIKIYFKIRPDVTQEKQLQHYGFLSGDNVVIVKKIDAEVLSQIDAVAGVYSTFLSEMIYYEKPIFQLDCSFDLGHYLKDDALATLLPVDFNLKDILEAITAFHSLKSVVWPPAPDINLLFKELIP